MIPMSDAAAGTELTTLQPADGATDSGLARQYAYPDALTTCWVRANFVTSLDGAATTGGRSGGLGGAGDRALFGLMRELADVVVVGAGTVRTENYSGAQLGAGERAARQDRGQAEVPPIAIVTRSAQLNHDLLVFTHTEIPPLVLTSHNAAIDARTRLSGLAAVHDCSAGDPDEVDPHAMVATLAGLGLTRVLTEGGPSLLGTFIAADLLDELCLTIAPFVVGGKAKRVTDSPTEALHRMQRRHVLTDSEGYLYTRYSRAAHESSA
jgi:riboflavin biosynthesis pyrimidine reductase